MRQDLLIGVRERCRDLGELIEFRPEPSKWIYILGAAGIVATFATPEEVRPAVWALSLLLTTFALGIVALFVAAWVFDGAIRYALGRWVALRSNQALANSAALHACQGQPPAR
ncbi:hypothetical protein BH11ARM2_BH11ARM2_16810 [soil metagenome]